MSNTSPALPSRIAPRPEPPYYAVIFTSCRNSHDATGYGDMAEWMTTLATQQPGYLGMESAREADGLGITVSYWQSLDDVAAWRHHAEHALARDKGRADWYDAYALRVSRVERAYGWERNVGPADLADPADLRAGT